MEAKTQKVSKEENKSHESERELIKKITGCKVIDVSYFDADNESMLDFNAIGFTIDARNKRISKKIRQRLSYLEFLVDTDEQKPTIYKYLVE